MVFERLAALTGLFGEAVQWLQYRSLAIDHRAMPWRPDFRSQPSCIRFLH
jgi:hypothetical protein